MGKVIRITGIILLCTFIFAGCRMKGYDSGSWALPSNSVSYDKRDGNETDMMYITVGDRSYMPYGTAGKRINEDMIRECLGYTDGDRNARIYTLSNDPYDNYLMLYNVSGIMEQPDFWRASDTMGKSVFTPDFINSLGYDAWASSGGYGELREAKTGLVINADDIVLLSYEYTINGRPGGGGQTGHADGTVIGKGEVFNIGITEVDIRDKADEEAAFDAAIQFSVTDSSGQVHKVDGVYERQRMLGSVLNDLEIRNDPAGGYFLFEDV